MQASKLKTLLMYNYWHLTIKPHPQKQYAKIAPARSIEAGPGSGRLRGGPGARLILKGAPLYCAISCQLIVSPPFKGTIVASPIGNSAGMVQL